MMTASLSYAESCLRSILPDKSSAVEAGQVAELNKTGPIERMLPTSSFQHCELRTTQCLASALSVPEPQSIPINDFRLCFSHVPNPAVNRRAPFLCRCLGGD
jgi:hypothetical protein